MKNMKLVEKVAVGSALLLPVVAFAVDPAVTTAFADLTTEVNSYKPLVYGLLITVLTFTIGVKLTKTMTNKAV